MRLFEGFDHHFGNIDEMMRRVGIDPEDATTEELGEALSSVLRACRSCRAREDCTDWLARITATVYRAPAFCPNAERLEDLALEQAVALRTHRVH